MDPYDEKPAAAPLPRSVANVRIPSLYPLTMGNVLQGISDALQDALSTLEA
jgi:hypothetical protein